jgi:hypothetical protein
MIDVIQDLLDFADFKPDWEDDKQWKYVIYKYEDWKGDWATKRKVVGLELYFKSQAHAEEAIEIFKDSLNSLGGGNRKVMSDE